MWLCHCSVIWDPVAAVTPVPRALRGCGQFCHILVLLTAPKLGAGSCRNASSPCKTRRAVLCHFYIKYTKGSLESEVQQRLV